MRKRKMKIEITKNEFKTLFEMIEIAEWVLHAHKIDEPEETKPYRDFEQKICGLAKDFGYGHLVDYDPKLQSYFPTLEFEETNPSMDYIEEFENDSFWEELVERLVARDVIREVGEKKYGVLDPMALIRKEEPHRTRYEEEFDVYGIDRLEIVSGSMVKPISQKNKEK
jgi:type IV secretory pathway VirB4 component